MQHTRSWCSNNLKCMIRRVGFELPFCMTIDLRRMGRTGGSLSLLDTSLRDLLRTGREVLLNQYATLADSVAPRSFPHGRIFLRRLPTYRQVQLVAVSGKRA